MLLYMCVLHVCSAGVGRTGTFIALDIALEQLAAERALDLIGIINKMRAQRARMVQTLVGDSMLMDIHVNPLENLHFFKLFCRISLCFYMTQVWSMLCVERRLCQRGQNLQHS